MRKLLIVTYHFPPSAASGSFRLLGFARHLPKFGWETIVVAPPRMPLEPVDPELGRQVPPETQVVPVVYPRAWFVRPMKRFGPNAIWLPKAWTACNRLIRQCRPDALLTSGPPHCVHVLGLYLQRRYGIPWVADFRDPWITKGTGQPNNSVRTWWPARWEKKVMERADAIVANAPLAAKSLRNSFPNRSEKIKSITNGYDAENFDFPASQHSSNGTVRVVHTGELYAGRDPRPFLDALQHLDRDGATAFHPVRVSFVGRNDEGPCNLDSEIKRRGLGGVTDIGGQVPYREAIRQLIGADILLLIDSPGRRIGVPAKLYEYMGAGRPILALAEADSDVAWALRESGVPHRIAPPIDPVRIKKALIELAAEVANDGVPKAAEERLFSFSREGIASQLAALLNDCCQRSCQIPCGEFC